MTSADSILEVMHDKVVNKEPIPPSWWVDAAFKLNVLIGDEHDRLYSLEGSIAKERAAYIADDNSVAAADAYVEASDDYPVMRRQKAKINQIEEFIRIAKIRAKLQDEEFRNN